LAGAAAFASDGGQTQEQGNVVPVQTTSRSPVYVIPRESEVSTLYHDGSRIAVETEDRWSLMCGSNPGAVTNEDLQRFAEMHYAAMATGPVWIIDNPDRNRANLNIVFNVDGSVPAQAVTALGVAEAYIESLFSDPITVTITVSFADLGSGGVIGATSSSYVTGVAYSTSRAGLVNGMDSNDSIQSWLPTGSTCPVRFNGGSDTVSNQSTVNWTRANYRATVGTVTGNAANMQFNTLMTFDYDPSNGITPGILSFVDVAVHETGHALGFTSATDFGGGMTALDLYRFQRADGCCDYNPDTLEEFQVRPRLVSYNLPDDEHISDLISAEYRMSDGNPWQASHFHEPAPYIGLMGPWIANGETHYPDYFSSADKNMFDAVGYDYPPCTVPQFTQQPSNQSGCVGGAVNMTVAVNIPAPAYQWRRGTTNLVNDGVHILGATSATLTIANLLLTDTDGQYNCFVTNTADGCTAASNNASVIVYVPVSFTLQPSGQTISEFATVGFGVTAAGEPPFTYQWRHNGVNLVNGGKYTGVTTPGMLVWSAEAPQAGYYDCVVTNLCGPVASNAAHLIVNTNYGAGRGDLNCSGAVNFGDINPFVLALSAGEWGYYDLYGFCHWYNADINSDGTVGFADINPFVALLAGK
jgi:hypothetical protein